MLFVEIKVGCGIGSVRKKTKKKKNEQGSLPME